MKNTLLTPLKRGTLLMMFLLSFFFISVFFLYGFEEKKNVGIKKQDVFVVPDTLRIQAGDLIVRHGKGFISNAFMQFSLKEAKYSHSGLISIEDGVCYVYHAIGGEENPGNKLRKETLSSFCDPQLVYSFGLFRYAMSEVETMKTDSLMKAYFKAGLEFDTGLDLKTDNKMYCSEFVYKILKKAAQEKNMIPLSRISGNEYVAIDNLYMNEYCSPLYQYSYK